jgi:hypothetical protein
MNFVRPDDIQLSIALTETSHRIETPPRRINMPADNKQKYTEKQKKKAADIEDSYEQKGVSKSEAEARAWATVNKQSGGGEREGGSGKKKSPGAKAESRKDSAKRAVATKHGASPNQSSASQTKGELMQQARDMNIPGRSSMSKEELVNAVRKASK